MHLLQIQRVTSVVTEKNKKHTGSFGLGLKKFYHNFDSQFLVFLIQNSRARSFQIRKFRRGGRAPALYDTNWIL